MKTLLSLLLVVLLAGTVLAQPPGRGPKDNQPQIFRQPVWTKPIPDDSKPAERMYRNRHRIDSDKDMPNPLWNRLPQRKDSPPKLESKDILPDRPRFGRGYGDGWCGRWGGYGNSWLYRSPWSPSDWRSPRGRVIIIYIPS